LLDEAIEITPELEARVRAVRAGALKLAGRQREAEREIAHGRSLTRDRELLDSYDRISRPTRRRSAGSWSYNASLGVGYDDNVALRSDSAPGSAPDEADYVFEPSLRGWVVLFEIGATRIVVDGNVEGVVHGDRSAFDEIFADAGLRVEHDLSDSWQVSTGLRAEYGNIDGDSYLYGTRGEIGVRWQQADWSETSLSYTLSSNDFRFAAVPQENRDGSLHRGVLAQTLRFPRLASGARVSPYVSVSREKTDGPSAENRGWGIGVDGSIRPVDTFTLFAGGGYRAYDYDNPHVRTGFNFAREDETWHARGGVRYRATDWITASARYSYLDKDSNIPTSFSYETNKMMVTLTLRDP
jgi:hypothetical protein